MWIAISFVVKGDICTHTLVYKKLLHQFPNKIDILLMVQLSRQGQFNRPGELGIGLGFVPFNAVPKKAAIRIFLWSIGWQHHLCVDNALLAGVVVGDSIPSVLQPCTADIGRRGEVRNFAPQGARHTLVYVSVRTSWLFLLGTPRGYPRNAPLHGHRPAASSCIKAENWALSIWMVCGKQASKMAPCSQSR